jgi:hypothetical protein
MLVAVVVTLLLLVAFSRQSPVGRGTDNSSFGPLTFSADGTFRISIFEDLHFGESKLLAASCPYPLWQPFPSSLD